MIEVIIIELFPSWMRYSKESLPMTPNHSCQLHWQILWRPLLHQMTAALSMLRLTFNLHHSYLTIIIIYSHSQDLEITNNILKDTIDFLRNGVHNQLLDRINTVCFL